ncbi:hypothetical protein EXE51_16225 [Halorubrum sp. CGM5_25_10-8B]|uniref:hypothetical protein n=1 Tax=Halorubrum sp. CGM5_25_10-8B TaxID=2518115 RepID=UPI0010F63F60|nr:hypothetical protein [Halorubrum sp. CGM5_25_10-8B]TKX35071.1 hypothetical protein EXE51_16225 [Halorubrum sp. CGM5_25_10-8B]
MEASAVLVALFLLLLITKWHGDRLYRFAALPAFFGHLFISIIVLPRLPYTWDIDQFHDVASAFVSGELVSTSSTVATYGTFQGLLYVFFPSEPVTAAVFNGLFAVLVYIPVAYLYRSLYPWMSDHSYGVMALILYLPLPFLFFSLPMRDALSAFSFISLLALGVYALRGRDAAVGLTMVPLWGMVFLLRPELGLVGLIGFGAAGSVKLIRSLGLELSIPSLAVVLGGLGALGFGLFAGVLYSFEAVNAELAYRAKGGAVYLDGMQYSSWFDFLLAAPGRAIYFIFTPFPLHVESVFHLLAFTATPIVIVLFVSAIRSLYECEFDETVAVLLVVVFLAGSAGYGAINSNFGTGVRHRMTLEFILVIVAAPVISRWELLVGEWLGVVPRHGGEHDEQQRKAQKLDCHVEARREYPDEAGE